MKKQTRITLIALITILILVVLGSTIYFYVQKYAYADYEDLTSDYVVNFNQLVSNTYIDYEYPSSQSTIVTNSFSYSGSAKYYVRITSNEATTYAFTARYINGNSSDLVAGTSSIDAIYTASDVNNFSIYPVASGLKLTNFNIYNLTMMFGAGNEPSIDQAREYFTSVRYSYNAGTPMPYSVSYLDGYVNGVNDTLGVFSYKLVTESIQSSMQAVNYGDYYGEITAYQNYVRITGTSDKVTAGYMPLLATIETGTHFKITGGFSHNDGHNNLPITIAYLGNNGVMIEIQTKKVSGGGNTPISFEFDAPSNINGFYILFNDDIDNPSIFIYKFECEILIKDVYALVETAYQNGYGKAKNDYLPGNDGYNEIFNAGKQYAITHNQNNAWGSAWDFIESAFTGIGSIFTIQLLPGVPLSIFILVPLMVSLIFFIVKLVKGGG